MKRWFWVISLGAVALLAVALFGASALAGGPRGPRGTPAQGPVADAADGSYYYGLGCPMHDAGGYGMMGGWMMGGYGGGVVDQVTLGRVAGVLGMSASDLTPRLQGGQTVAQVAQDKGVSLDLVVDTLLAPESDMLAVRVKYGYMTQAEADATLALTRTRVTQALTSARPRETVTGPVVPGTPGYAPEYGSGTGPGYGGGMMGGWYGGGMMGGGYGPGMMGGGMMGW